MILAEGELSFLVYLVIGFLWLVGNLVEQKKAKRKVREMREKREAREREEARRGGSPSSPPPRQAPAQKKSPDPDLEKQLEDFLGRLAGETPQKENKTAPASPASAPAQRSPQQRAPIRRNNQPSRPKAKIQFDGKPPAAPPPPPLPQKPQAEELSYEQAYGKIENIEEIEEIDAQLDGELGDVNLLRGVQPMRIDLSDSTVTMPTIPTPSMNPIVTQTHKQHLTDKRGLKKALVSSILLGPCKALQPNPFEGQDGGV